MSVAIDHATNDVMTSRERTELAQLVRRREKVAKTTARQRAAELQADVEAQLAATYERDDERWKEITAAAEKAVAKADAEIARRCEAQGIPTEFRLGLYLNWHARGVNAQQARRAELRKVATTRIAAMEAAARAEIERASVDVQTQLLESGLTTVAAHTFLASMPSVDELMPAMPLAELEEAVALPRGRGWE